MAKAKTETVRLDPKVIPVEQAELEDANVTGTNVSIRKTSDGIEVDVTVFLERSE